MRSVAYFLYYYCPIVLSLHGFWLIASAAWLGYKIATKKTMPFLALLVSIGFACVASIEALWWHYDFHKPRLSMCLALVCAGVWFYLSLMEFRLRHVLRVLKKERERQDEIKRLLTILWAK